MNCSKYFSLLALLTLSCTNSSPTKEPVQPAASPTIVPTPAETPTTEAPPTPATVAKEEPSNNTQRTLNQTPKNQ